MTANNKKNKTCLYCIPELNPFELLNAWIWSEVIIGTSELIGDSIGDISL